MKTKIAKREKWSEKKFLDTLRLDQIYWLHVQHTGDYLLNDLKNCSFDDARVTVKTLSCQWGTPFKGNFSPAFNILSRNRVRYFGVIELQNPYYLFFISHTVINELIDSVNICTRRFFFWRKQIINGAVVFKYPVNIDRRITIFHLVSQALRLHNVKSYFREISSAKALPWIQFITVFIVIIKLIEGLFGAEMRFILWPPKRF